MDIREEERRDSDKAMLDREQTELLRRLCKRQEKDILLARIIAGAECTLLVMMIIVFSVVVPRLLGTLARLDTEMEQIEELTEEAQAMVGEITKLVQDTDEMVLNNNREISEALSNFNSVDFESLNDSIQKISEIITPIAELVHSFP